MAGKGNEQRLADQMEKGLNTMTFNPGLFAHFMTSTDIRVQTAVYDTLMACVREWAGRNDQGVMESTEGINLYAKSKRIQDHLQGYK